MSEDGAYILCALHTRSLEFTAVHFFNCSLQVSAGLKLDESKSA
jgi:hypothetical protein